MVLVQPEQEHTEIPQLPAEPDADPAGDAGDDHDEPPSPGGRASGGRARRRPREADVTDEPPPPEPRETVTEQQLVRAFYWLYRGWCRLLGAQVDAQHSDFQDLGKAWLELARKVPGIRWVIAAAGPIFTLTDLLDKLAVAWSARTRLRKGFQVPSWRQRSQTGAEAPDVPVGDGSAGAP
ncbi:MAG TPA: hypothetical protein VJX92_15505 [Methylomirabilota bacterium]|nr:hypothetical protein [Methylomirabilota bacterium]